MECGSQSRQQRRMVRKVRWREVARLGACEQRRRTVCVVMSQDGIGTINMVVRAGKGAESRQGVCPYIGQGGGDTDWDDHNG
jgi:hypothetical protein